MAFSVLHAARAATLGMSCKGRTSYMQARERPPAGASSTDLHIFPAASGVEALAQSGRSGNIAPNCSRRDGSAWLVPGRCAAGWHERCTIDLFRACGRGHAQFPRRARGEA
jgi:hypothetical protein